MLYLSDPTTLKLLSIIYLMLFHWHTVQDEEHVILNCPSQELTELCTRTENLPPLFHDGEVLPYCNTFRYLGMMFDKRINLHNAAEEALKPCLASMAHMHTFAHQYQITHRLHAYLRLLKTYVIPADRYASQIWATPYLQQGIEMDNSIQKWLLRFLGSMFNWSQVLRQNLHSFLEYTA
eukprot:1138243-Pelagomonas_calceolata.AAC.1